MAVTVFVRIDVVQLFTTTVRVEVGSVIVRLTCAIPDAIVTGLGVLGIAVSWLTLRLCVGQGSQCLRRSCEEGIYHCTCWPRKGVDDGRGEIPLHDGRGTEI